MRCVVSYENHCIVSDFYVYAMIIIEDIIVMWNEKKKLNIIENRSGNQEWVILILLIIPYISNSLLMYFVSIYILCSFFVTIISVRYVVLLELLFWFCLNCCRINLRTKVS